MGRLIDADAIHYHQMWEEDWTKQTIYFGHGVPEWEIDEMPTVDAEPVRHGKWIIRDNPGTGWYRITCSECGEDVTSNAPCIGFFPNAKVTWNYCPECGAKMDGERKEE